MSPEEARKLLDELNMEKGVWVFCTGQPLSASVTDDLLAEIREQRDKQNLAAPN